MGGRVIFRGGLSQLGKQATLPTIWDYIEHGYTFMQEFGFSKFGHKRFAELFDTESIHFHGGGYLVGQLPQKALMIGLAASFAKIYETRLFATGIGFGPISAECPDPVRFEEIMSFFEFFEVRDSVSYDLMKSVAPTKGLFHGTDDCFMVPADKVFRRDSSCRRLHLSLSHGFVELYPDHFWPWLASESARFEEVFFWESYPWFDEGVFQTLRKWIPNLKRHTTRSLLFEPPAIGDDDVFVTHRFHVHYAAARAGARGFYLAPTPYYVQKHESIVGIGSGLLPLDFNDLPSLEDIPAGAALDEAALRAQKLSVAAKCYPPKTLTEPRAI